MDQFNRPSAPNDKEDHKSNGCKNDNDTEYDIHLRLS